MRKRLAAFAGTVRRLVGRLLWPDCLLVFMLFAFFAAMLAILITWIVQL